MAIDFLHPLTGDTVGTSFEALVGYDFRTIRAATVQVTLTLSGGTATPSTQTVDVAANPTGELTFAVSGLTSGTDYTISVSTVPDLGTDTENSIHALAPNLVPIQITLINGPTPVPAATANANATGLALSTYTVSGTSLGGAGQVKLKARSLDTGHGHQVIGLGNTPANAAGDWSIPLVVIDDGREYVVIEAQKGSAKRNRGRKRV
jgi:hypothetical protein